MPLSDSQLRYYDSQVLRLPQDKRTQYHEQVDRLIRALKNALKDQHAIKVTKVVKAGSFAKYTILRKTNEDAVDVDLVFYLAERDIAKETLSSLSKIIADALIKLYPNKAVEDFVIQSRAATVTFVGSGLNVDVVPVIEDAGKDGYGWQYDIRNGSKAHTCAPYQIKFVRDRKDIDSNFRTLVRIAKRWRTHVELPFLKSFVIELIMARVLEKNGSAGSIESRFRDFLLYIAQSELKEKIIFPENGSESSTFSDPVVILDPVCSTNNVASRLSEEERKQIIDTAQESWEIAHFASAEDDMSEWKKLFGPRFKVEPT